MSEIDGKCEAGLVYKREASDWSRFGERRLCRVYKAACELLKRLTLRENHNNFDSITNVFYK